jgi:hypothetical protein
MAEIEKIAVYDARIIQDPPKYAVQKGALSVSTSQFQANAANASQLSFQVLVPSLNVFTDRKLELNASAYVYAEAVPSQIVTNIAAQNSPFPVAAGRYIDEIDSGNATSYGRAQDTPSCPSYAPPLTTVFNNPTTTAGNTATILQDNAWPNLGSSSTIGIYRAIAPTVVSMPPTAGTSGTVPPYQGTNPAATWQLFPQTSVDPAPFGNYTSVITPAFVNPFQIFSGQLVSGVFSVDYNLKGICQCAGVEQVTSRMFCELIDPTNIPGGAFGSFVYDVNIEFTVGGGGSPITVAVGAGTAPVTLNRSGIGLPQTLAWRMTYINAGFFVAAPGPTTTMYAAVNGQYFQNNPQANPGATMMIYGFNQFGQKYLNLYQSIGTSTDLSLGMFPIQSLATSMTCTINDCSVSVQGDVLREQLLISQTRDSLMQRTCPSKFDVYAWTQDDVKAINGVTAGFNGARDSDIPNGSYPIRYVHPTTGALLNQFDAYQVTLSNGTIVTVPVLNWTPAFIPLNSNLIGQNMPSSSISGGFWTIVPTNVDVVTPIMYRFQTTEPLCLSPFMWQDSKQMTEVGLYGITNMTVNMTLGNPGAIQGYIKSTTTIPVGGRQRVYVDKLDNAFGSYQYMTRQSGINALFGNVRLQPPTSNLGNQTGPWVAPPRLLCTFLTPPPEITLPLVSSVPYVEFPRYNSSGSVTWASNGTVSVSSNTVTLSSIPDLLVVYVKPAFRGQTQSDTYIPISNIGVTFDNYANLCSNYSQEDLYACSVAGGLDMDFNQFRGFSRSKTSTNTPAISGQLGSTVFDTFQGYSPNVQLTGAPILLRMGQDIPLSSGLAPGTLGNYSVQVNVTLDNTNGFFNYLSQLQTSNNVIVTIMAVNSGFFESVRGSSALRKTILNTNDVEAASTSSSVTSSQLVRLVGGASGMHTSSRLTTSLGMPQFKPAMGDEQRVRKMARMSGSGI